jgi:hypothetical protein
MKSTDSVGLQHQSALLLIARDGGATSNKRYCNKLALSSLVNNQNESNR